MFEHIYQFVKELIIKVSLTEFSFLVTNIFGLFIPALFTILIFIFMSKSEDRKIYGTAYIISIASAFIMGYFNIGFKHKLDDGFSSLHFLSLYPIIIFLHYFIKVEFYNTRERINSNWMFLGTFSSALFTDCYLSYTTSTISFKFDGIGGAGIFDGLLITSVIAYLSSILVNKMSEYKKLLT